MFKGKKKWMLAAALSVVMSLSLVIPAFAAFWNLTGDTVVHDPTIIKVGTTYHVFSTGQGIQHLTSSNGTSWSRTNQVFASPLSWWKTYVPNQATNDLWAPDIEYYNGKYWLYYSISSFGSNTSAIGLASATNINGPWTDNGLVIRTTSSNNYNAIDPHLFIDPSGNPWLSFGSFWSGLKLTRLDKNTMKPTGSLTSIASRSGGIEAPTIAYRQGYYYLFASIDSCCQGVNSTYKMVVGRSTSITGPYVDQNGVSMMNGGGTIIDAGNVRWKGPGHQDVYNNNIIIRHAYDADDNGTPKLLINDLNWPNGWPSY
ncbi:arabinan endo-1,5-alpha-L-arabinosidase [Paenibacillus nanensis]|uniref:Endo-alpha-(1->5)-L-arabinanase n=1 Tax=Paenibacillus nanensis TaxID=393251 RepID=A0A3A1UZG8_9BACL|nr:glycoside hydrolase family 43 protein [Paenibacillus nanensis]RIX53989.1 arabinan endo-1,5-alpha-L-arabinosidase [Paenibacillus nanensis]